MSNEIKREYKLPETPEKIIADAKEHAESLCRERSHRQKNTKEGKAEHADDIRIAREIAETQFKIGKLRKGIVEQSARWRKALIRNDEQLRQLRLISTNLNTEMNILTHWHLPDVIELEDE